MPSARGVSTPEVETSATSEGSTANRAEVVTSRAEPSDSTSETSTWLRAPAPSSEILAGFDADRRRIGERDGGDDHPEDRRDPERSRHRRFPG